MMHGRIFVLFWSAVGPACTFAAIAEPWNNFCDFCHGEMRPEEFERHYTTWVRWCITDA